MTEIRRRKRKFISLLLCFLLIAGLVPNYSRTKVEAEETYNYTKEEVDPILVDDPLKDMCYYPGDTIQIQGAGVGASYLEYYVDDMNGLYDTSVDEGESLTICSYDDLGFSEKPEGNYQFDCWKVLFVSEYSGGFSLMLEPVFSELYTITWRNDDNSVLEKDENQKAGSPVSYDGSTPEMAGEKEAGFDYEFSGWDPKPSETVTGDAFYTAVYSKTKQKFTVIWYDENESSILEKDENVEYGTMPSYDGEEPKKTADAEFTYTFSGWQGTYEAVTKNMYFVAKYTATRNSYEVIWKNYDGEVLETDKEVEYGSSPSYDGATPTKPQDAQYKYTFSGWSPELETVKGQQEYTAQYTPVTRTYTIRWWNENGDLLETDEEVPYGAIPSYDQADPVKDADAQYFYTFDTWSPSVHSVTGDENYTATYTNDLREYTILWVDEDGTILEKDEYVPYGTMPSFDGTEPKKASTAQFDYAFDKWSPSVHSVTGEEKYTATYTETLREYTILWVDEDGTLLEKDEHVPYGTMPSFDKETPTKASTAQYSYEFAGWGPEVKAVSKDETYKASYTGTVNTYTVFWRNSNGELLEKDKNVPYGTIPSYDGATPTKAKTAQYTYSFKGWSPKIEAVTKEVTYTAVFDAKVNCYTVLWKDEDGTILEKDEKVPYGTTPSYDGTTPKKAATAKNSYEFSDWSPEIHTVTGDETYTATYRSTVNAYTVSWKNEDGTLLEYDENVPYGTIPTYDGATPKKTANAQYTYSFKAWSPVVDAVTGNAIYYATFSKTLNTYTITWKDEDGTVLERDRNVPYGTKPSYNGATPVKEGNAQYTYSYSGWDKKIENVVKDETYIATYTSSVNTYQIVWKDEDDTTLETDPAVLYGAMPEYNGVKPVKEGNAQYTYAFSGWSPELESVSKNAVYHAVYTESLNHYTVTWKDEDGTVLEKDEDVPYGAMPSYDGAEPGKQKTAKYTYQFNGWDSTPVVVTSDATYTATYKSKLNHYTVKWVDEDGTVLEQDENVSYGAMPSFDSSLPEKEGNAQYSYTFTGWNKKITAVTGNAVYKATYRAFVNCYSVTWLNENGDLLELDESVPYGTVPHFDGAEPKKAADAANTYQFADWGEEIVPVTQDAVYKAVFAAVPNRYTVIWADEDGTELEKDENVLYGTMPRYNSKTPVKKETAKYSYRFAGWDKTLTAVKQDVTYTAQYEATLRVYTVTWLDEDGSVLEVDEKVPYGTMPSFDGAEPEKEATAQYTYRYTGWNKELTAVKKDVTYKAVYSSELNTYTVTWLDEDGSILELDEKVPYGTMPSYDGAEPEKAADEENTYGFSDWDHEIEPVTKDAEYKAVYTSTTNTFTVTWLDEDGSILEVDEEVPYGTLPSYDGAEPEKEATAQYTYRYTGWNKELTAVKKDVTYKAVYSSELNTYTVTWLDEDGHILEVDEEVPYGTLPSYDGAEPEKAADEENTYGFSDWDHELEPVTKDAEYKAVYTSTTNTFTVTWLDEDGSILEVDEEVPYGTLPSYDGEEPEKEATAQYTYRYTGWNKELTAVKKDVTYKAVYSSELNTYTVTWLDEDGHILEVDEEVPYGTMPSYDGADPEKAATAQYTYQYAGWNKELTAVKQDVTYTAQYEAALRAYTVTWLDEDGSILEVDEEVPYGTMPSYDGEEPEKAATAQYTYQYAGWNKELTAVKQDVTYKAVYSSELNTYSVTWLDEDGSILEVDEKVPYGTLPSYDGAEPEKAADEENTYGFSDWDHELEPVTKDAEYKAVYTSTTNTFTVTWLDEDGSVLEIDEEVPYGTLPSYDGEEPEKEATAQYFYHYIGWDKEQKEVRKDVTYTALYETELRTYTVTWLDEDDSILEIDEKAPYGSVPNYDGKEPVKPETDKLLYKFTGWNPEVAEVEGDVIYKAQYSAEEKVVEVPTTEEPKKPEVPSVKTGDDIQYMLIVFGISGMGLFGILLYGAMRRRREQDGSGNN